MSKAKVKTENAVEIIRNAAQLGKLMDTMLVTSKGLEKMMHQAACSVLWHVGQHKDIRQVRALLERMDEMGAIRVNAVKAWFEAFGPVSFDDKQANYAKDKPLKLAQAQEKPFWLFAPEKAYMPLDVVQSLNALIKKLEKDEKEMGYDHSSILLALSIQIKAETANQQEKKEQALKAATDNAAKDAETKAKNAKLQLSLAPTIEAMSAVGALEHSNALKAATTARLAKEPSAAISRAATGH